MKERCLEIVQHESLADTRGTSFPLGSVVARYLGSIDDLHCSSIRPGERRGDHYHERRDEVLLVVHTDELTLLHDAGPDTPAASQRIAAPPPDALPGLVEIRIPTGCSHALLNSGSADLMVFGLSNGPYDPGAPDSYPRPLGAPAA